LAIGVALTLLLFVPSVLGSERAQAANSGSEPAALPIAIEFDGCEALDQVELSKLLAIEFHTLNVLPATPRERVHIRCAAQRAVVELESDNSWNQVNLAATAAAVWPRLLALAVSEIVTDARARVTPSVAVTATPGPVAPALAPRARKPPGNGGIRGFAGLALRLALRPATWLAGPDLGVTLDLNRYVSVAADLRLELGRTDTTLAQIDWLSASGAFALLAGGSVGRWAVGVGPGLCVGYLRLSAQTQVASATGHSVSGIWLGPELVARARYDWGTRGFVLGGVDSGIATTSVTGLVNGEQSLIDTGGPWASAVVGAGLRF
jgi:hypothetical protein